MSGIPYRVIRLVAGAAALLVSIYVFVSEAEVVPSVFGLASYVVGWYLAKRFGRPAAAYVPSLYPRMQHEPVPAA